MILETFKHMNLATAKFYSAEKSDNNLEVSIHFLLNNSPLNYIIINFNISNDSQLNIDDGFYNFFINNIIAQTIIKNQSNDNVKLFCNDVSGKVSFPLNFNSTLLKINLGSCGIEFILTLTNINILDVYFKRMNCFSQLYILYYFAF